MTAVDARDGGASYECPILEKKSLKKLCSPFVLPGSIWQLKCFVIRQPELADFKMGGANEAIIVTKASKTHKDHTVCSHQVCKDLEEMVDAEEFNYYYSVHGRTYFDPWKDMRVLHYEDGWSTPNSWQPCNAWWSAHDHEYGPVEVYIHGSSREYEVTEWFFQKRSTLWKHWGIDSFEKFCSMMLGHGIVGSTWCLSSNIMDYYSLQRRPMPEWQQRAPGSPISSIACRLGTFRYNNPGQWLTTVEQENIEVLRGCLSGNGKGCKGDGKGEREEPTSDRCRRIKSSRGVSNDADSGRFGQVHEIYLIEEEEFPTGYVIQVHVNQTPHNLVLSFCRLSGEATIPAANFHVNATVADLKALIDEKMGWIQTQIGHEDMIPQGHELLGKYGTFVASEIEQHYHLMTTQMESFTYAPKRKSPPPAGFFSGRHPQDAIREFFASSRHVSLWWL